MNVEQSLRELAQDDAAVRVPAHVDAAVMAAWDAVVSDDRKPAATDRRAWWAWAATAAAITVFAIAASMLARAGSASRNPAYGTQTYVGRVPQSGPADVRETPLAGSATRNPAYRSQEYARAQEYVERVPQSGPADIARRSGPAVRISQPPIDPGYVLVPGTASDSLTLMRVRMPRRAFSNLGLPIANPDGDGLVDVEVLVGEDGVARSIRRAAAVDWPEAN